MHILQTSIGGDISWNGGEQSRIHTSYYVGALLAVLVADRLTKRVGPTILILFGAIVNVIGTFATPLFVIYLSSDYRLLVCIRLLMGIGQVRRCT